MTPSPRERYAARLPELEALAHELSTGTRPGDPAVLVGLLLEAAGDLLRRSEALGLSPGQLSGPLGAVPALALRAWAEGVQAAAFAERLARAMSQAVEVAIPDSPEEGEAVATFAVQELLARDRLESSLVALEALGGLGRVDAAALASRLRVAVSAADQGCRAGVASLTALNPARRAEAALLDVGCRAQAWWFSERSGIDDDRLVQVLGGEAGGTVPPEVMRLSAEVTRRRGRSVGFDELLRLDLGLASAAERAIIERQAAVDPELRLALAAMEAAEEALAEAPQASPASSSPPKGERAATPDLVEERADFKVLVFRSKRGVQLVVQPRDPDQLAAAAVRRADAPDAGFPSRPGALGLHFELGDPARLVGALARVTVEFKDGHGDSLEVRL